MEDSLFGVYFHRSQLFNKEHHTSQPSVNTFIDVVFAALPFPCLITEKVVAVNRLRGPKMQPWCDTWCGDPHRLDLLSKQYLPAKAWPIITWYGTLCKQMFGPLQASSGLRRSQARVSYELSPWAIQTPKPSCHSRGVLSRRAIKVIFHTLMGW